MGPSPKTLEGSKIKYILKLTYSYIVKFGPSLKYLALHDHS